MNNSEVGKENHKLMRLSVVEFAVPSPLTGSIDAYSGYGSSALEGIEIHQQVQKRRTESFSSYQAEVPISHTFEREGFSFLIQGRMDGLFKKSTGSKIEEIKSSVNLFKLLGSLKYYHRHHPYSLQLLTYGYFHWLQNREVPELSLHLVSTRSRESLDFPIELEMDNYESWLELRLGELVEKANREEKRSEKRRKVAAQLTFPFENPRAGQIELVKTIETGMKDQQRMLIQAPTGLGKTIGVLYPVLKEALSRGQRVVYATPKNSQHAVAEDAIERFQKKGFPLKSLTITAKSKLCLKAEPLCNPTYCEYAKDYYDKLSQNNLKEVLSKKRKLSAKTFTKYGKKFELCPFELQLDVAEEADAIVCDYNYVFMPRSSLGRLKQDSFSQSGKANLVIDEAHNLPSRSMSYYSPALSVTVLEKIRGDFQTLSRTVRAEANQICLDSIAIVKECCKQADSPEGRIGFSAPVDAFMDQDALLGAFLSKYLNLEPEIRPNDPVLRLCFYWSAFTDILVQIDATKKPEFFLIARDGSIKITCCDASDMLKPCYQEYDQVVGFSATLKPFEFYAEFMGLNDENLKTSEFASPFSKSNRKLLIIPQISTRYQERERNYQKIAVAIGKISAIKTGNYFVFFPSFDFMERVCAIFQAPQGFSVIRQERNSKAAEIEAVLERLRNSTANLVFAVQGGVFSEGVDYPGDMLIGAFVVGPPLPGFDPEREGMRKYYEKTFKKGFDYAYAYPAMAKAVQAAGRVIRTTDDRGIIILMDSRFLESSYAKSMPGDWFENGPMELVSNKILTEISEFWDGTLSS